MDIFPKDLGNNNYNDVLNNRRSLVGFRHRISPTITNLFQPAPLTPMRKLWMFGTTIESQAVEYATPAFDMCNCAVFQWIPAGFRWTLLKVIGAFLLVTYAWPFMLLYFGILKPRTVFKEMHRRLSYDDLAALGNATHDPLKTDFLRLVEAAIKMPADENTQEVEKMQKAFYALGNSINLLPILDVAIEDADCLKAEAKSLVELAKTEADPVVAASFQRRSDAISQRAASADHNNTVLRRSRVLRDELLEQIRALQASLAITNLNTGHHAGRLTDVAASIQQIAGHANSVAAAQAEIETISVTPVPMAISIANAQVSRRNL